jgi:hypothetical protein
MTEHDTVKDLVTDFCVQLMNRTMLGGKQDLQTFIDQYSKKNKVK